MGGEQTGDADTGIDCGPSLVDITVTDTGRAGGTPNLRHTNGLRGVRERVAMLGGTFRTGDRPGGGFQVHAELPVAVHDGAH